MILEKIYAYSKIEWKVSTYLLPLHSSILSQFYPSVPAWYVSYNWVPFVSATLSSVPNLHVDSWCCTFSTFGQKYSSTHHYHNKFSIFTILEICILLPSPFSPKHHEIIYLLLSVYCYFLHNVTSWIHTVVYNPITLTYFTQVFSVLKGDGLFLFSMEYLSPAWT